MSNRKETLEKNLKKKMIEILTQIVVNLRVAKFSYTLASESDKWIETNKPQHNQLHSHLDSCWLFTIVHRTSILSIASILERRQVFDKSGSLQNLQKVLLQMKIKNDIEEFYNANNIGIQKIMSIRDEYIGHASIRPKDDGQINSEKVTRILISKLENIIKDIVSKTGTNPWDYDTETDTYINKIKEIENIKTFANLVLELKN